MSSSATAQQQQQQQPITATPSSSSSLLTNDLSGKYFQALVTGLIKREYYGELEFSNSMLLEQLFTDSQLDASARQSLLEGVLALIHKAAQHNWDIARLGSVCERTQLTEEQREILLRLWKTHASKIHDQLVNQSVWSSTMGTVQWRIDIKTTGKRGELNEPTAIMELGVNNHNNTNERIQFEMTRDEVDRTLTQLQQIQAAIDRVSGGSSAAAAAATTE